MIVFTPVVVKNITIKDNTISIFNIKVDYEPSEDGVYLLYDGYRFGELTAKEKLEFDGIVAELSNSDMPRSFGIIELAAIVGAATTFLLYFIFTYVHDVFYDIYYKDTPFTKENSDRINKIAYLAMISVIISFVADVISSLLFDNSMVNFNLKEVLLVIVLYVVVYVFDYACILQTQSKTKIYNEEKKS